MPGGFVCSGIVQGRARRPTTSRRRRRQPAAAQAVLEGAAGVLRRARAGGNRDRRPLRARADLRAEAEVLAGGLRPPSRRRALVLPGRLPHPRAVDEVPAGRGVPGRGASARVPHVARASISPASSRRRRGPRSSSSPGKRSRRRSLRRLAEPAARHEEAVGVDATARFLNRELSRLDYDARVLALRGGRRAHRRSSAPSSSRSSARTSTSSSRSASRACSEQLTRGRARHVARRHDARASSSSAIRARVAGARRRARRACSRARCARACARRASAITDWDDLKKPEREQLRRGLRGARLPGAHAARGRPGASVPVHLRPVAQPRGRRARPVERRRSASRA